MEDGSTKPILLRAVSLQQRKGMHTLTRRHWPSYLGLQDSSLPGWSDVQYCFRSQASTAPYLFAETKPVPAMASARIQQWALTLSAYDHTIRYKPGPQNANAADLFSRLPLPEAPTAVPLPGETILLLEKLATSPITESQVRTATARDPMLSRVAELVPSGWNHTENNSITPSF